MENRELLDIINEKISDTEAIQKAYMKEGNSKMQLYCEGELTAYWVIKQILQENGSDTKI